MSDPDAERRRIRTDLVAVVAGSCLIALYLLLVLSRGEWAHSGESRPEARAVAASQDPDRPETTDARAGEPAPWVQAREPVPPHVLYPYTDDPEAHAPPPPQEAKGRSWHNRLLFPTAHCPYCGRRVPTQRASYFWLLVGFVGQIAFSMRFLVQWIATERARASVIPVSFWYLSIFGSVLLLGYAISIVAWPIILGQAPNVLIYSRNLYFIQKREPPPPEADIDPSKTEKSET